MLDDVIIRVTAREYLDTVKVRLILNFHRIGSGSGLFFNVVSGSGILRIESVQFQPGQVRFVRFVVRYKEHLLRYHVCDTQRLKRKAVFVRRDE